MYTETFKIQDNLNFPWGKVWYGIAGTGDRTPLLVLHGGPGYPSDYLWNLGELGDNRQIIFYDQSGCGRSDRLEDNNLWSVGHFVQELALIRKELQLDTVHILGHSWGTMLLASYLKTHPSGISSLTFASPCIDIWRWIETTNRYLDNLPNNWGNLIRECEAVGDTENEEYKKAKHLYHTTHECRIHPHTQLMQEASKGFSVPIYRHMWGNNEYTVTGTLKDYADGDVLQDITVPTLFTCGAYDAAEPASVQAYASQVPEAEIKVFEQSSHMPHIEQSDVYLKIVREFLHRND